MPDMLDLPSYSDDDTPTQPQRLLVHRALGWWRTRWMTITGAVLLFILAVGVTFGVVYALNRQPTYHTQPARVGTLALTFGATGVLQATVYEATLPTGSKVSAINVKVGDQVAAGQTLATLDAIAQHDAVNAAQASVSAAQASLGSARNNLAFVEAQSNAQISAAADQERNAIFQCTHEKSPPPACVQQARDQFAATQAQSRAQLAQAEALLSNAQAQVAAANAQLQAAQHTLVGTTITAPHAGTVAAINGTVGSSVAGGSGANSSGAFITIADISSLQVLASVTEADIGRVSAGNPASFTVSALPGRIFRGTVSTISPLGQTTRNVVTYPVTIDVDRTSLGTATPLPGMNALVTITTLQRTGVVLIPVSAVTFAQNAARPGGSGAITPKQAQSALSAARDTRDLLVSEKPELAADNPQPAFVLEQAKDNVVVKPVVLGVSDGKVYEVLAGLSADKAVITGA
jgi:multidrug efflux pump subunit AcrA (membrane-fusion protein)